MNYHLVESTFARLKDFRRIATRHSKIARNVLSAVALTPLITFWLYLSLKSKIELFR